MKALEYDYQGKFQLVTEPLQSLPHKCAGCNRESSYDSQNPLQFVDWNLEVEFFGKIFICTDCLREMCNQMGYASPKQVIMLESNSKLYFDRCKQLESENEELRNALGSLGVVFNNPIPSVDDLVPDKEDDDNADDITLGSTERETRSVEQTTKPGSTDVHDDASTDELSDLI